MGTSVTAGILKPSDLAGYRSHPVYIHPYMDGNGRIGRFLMNVMCASREYLWIIIPVEQRDAYMSALEEASVNQNIIPFCDFIAKLLIHSKK